MRTLTAVAVGAMVVFAAASLRTAPTPEPAFVEVSVLGVVHSAGGFSVLLAAGTSASPPSRPVRAMVIGVGASEGTAIALALGETQFARPLTHDLTMEILKRLHAELVGLTIHSLRHNTYFARLRLASGSDRIDLDCRPSDGIALALRAKAPIKVNPKLLHEMRLPSGSPEPARPGRRPPAKNAPDEPSPPKDETL